MNYFNEGNKLYNIQDYNRAIDCYKKSALQNQNEACSYYNAGVCFIKLKDYNNAITMLNKAINLQRESKYIFNLGYCYAMKECPDKALRLLIWLGPLILMILIVKKQLIFLFLSFIKI